MSFYDITFLFEGIIKSSKKKVIKNSHHLVKEKKRVNIKAVILDYEQSEYAIDDCLMA